jgi:predicted permease
MVLIGYIFTYIGWFNKKTSTLFSRIIVNLALPALMINNLMTSFSKDELIYMWSSITIPFLGVLMTYIISILISNWMEIREGRKGLFRALFTFSNTIFIGVPVNIALFGEKSVSIVTMYYIAHTTIFWTLGVYGIKKDKPGEQSKFFSLETLKRVFSPMLIAYLIGNILIFMKIPLPKFLMETSGYFRDLTTPLSMLFLGITMYYIDFKGLRIDKNIVAISLGCFVVTPLIVYSIFCFFSRPLLMKKVFIMEAAMPIMATIAIAAKAYGSDHQYATLLIAITTLISVFMVPIYIFLFSLM